MRLILAASAIVVLSVAPVHAAEIEKDFGAGFYRNVSGLCIHDPYGAPQTAETALCRDGTHRMSQHRRGTCSGHAGVAQWEAELPP